MRLLVALMTLAALAPVGALAQDTEHAPGGSISTEGAAGAAPEAVGSAWSSSINVYAYLVPDGDDFLQPTVSADRGRLHLEARYNYEGFNTGSLWVGYNLGLDGAVTLAFTPMVGAVVGDTDGVAPGYNLEISWRRITFFSQSEYLIDTNDSDNSFLYTWTELSLWPWDWLGAGLVVQRTRTADLGFEAEPGLLLGLAWKQLSIITYVFGLDESDQTVMVGAGLGF